MTDLTPDPRNPSRDSLDEIIARYLECERRGDPLDRRELIAEHPELADSLATFFANHDAARFASFEHEGETIGPENQDVMTLPPSAGESIRYFGDYELLEEIARGGMGVIYKARQVSLDRIVALKLILAGGLANEEDVIRFRTEAKAVASLDHQGIVPIYEIGEHDGQQFFSMKWIEGSTLDQRMSESEFTLREGVAIIAEVAATVDFAHRRGILHRDLKPANILLDAESGSPLVADFGLAKRIDDHSDVTQSGAIVGTPSYMPPEQAASEKIITTGADVYSLGAILYRLLTGRPPFTAKTPLETVIQILEGELIPPTRVNAGTPQNLELICMKCLRRDPTERYDSAGALAADLSAWLDDRPISIRPPTLFARVSEWTRMHLRTTLGLAVLGLLLGLILSVNVLFDIGPAFAGIGRSHPGLEDHWLNHVVGSVGSDVSRIAYSTGPIRYFAIPFLLATAGLIIVIVTRPDSRNLTVGAAIISGGIATATVYLLVLGWLVQFRSVGDRN